MNPIELVFGIIYYIKDNYNILNIKYFEDLFSINFHELKECVKLISNKDILKKNNDNINSKNFAAFKENENNRINLIKTKKANVPINIANKDKYNFHSHSNLLNKNEKILDKNVNMIKRLSFSNRIFFLNQRNK